MVINQSFACRLNHLQIPIVRVEHVHLFANQEKTTREQANKEKTCVNWPPMNRNAKQTQGATKSRAR